MVAPPMVTRAQASAKGAMSGSSAPGGSASAQSRRVAMMPWAISAASRSLSAGSLPAMMVSCGPFASVIVSAPAKPPMSAATWLSSARTAAHCRVPMSPCTRRARATSSRAASAALITPATQAAAYSPSPCPSTAAGWMPQARHCWARA